MAQHRARVSEVRRTPDLRHFAPRGVFFPPHMSPGKMIRILSGLRRKPGRGYPFPDLSPGDGGRRSPVNCLLLSECLRSAWPRSDFGGEGAAAAAGRGAPVGCLLLLEIPAVCLAAKRLRRREGRCSGRTGVPGRLPASIGSACCPPGREAASAEGPLRRQDGGPRSAACFYRKCLLSGSPLGGFAGGGFWRRKSKAPLWKGGRLRAPPGAEKARKKEWQWSKFCER